MVFPVLGILLMASYSPEITNEKKNAAILPDTSKLPSSCSIDNVAWQDGEEIVYKVYYNWNFVWMSAGEVTFRVKEEGDQYHLSVRGQTYPSYNWFYKVDDKYDTYVDKKTLLPNVSIRNVEEGKYTLYDKITFDRDRNIARSLRGKSKEVAEVTEYAIDDCMHDILSIIYFSRNIDFDKLDTGTAIPIKVFVDKKTWPLKVHYRGKDDKKRIRGNGRFRTILFSPEVATGFYFKTKDQLNVWISDDKNQIPLLIESPIRVGSVKVILKEYKGLRYDLEAEY